MATLISVKETVVSRNIPWVTLSKFIGLYLMIIGHKGLVDGNLTDWLYSFHMPLFFILSGMFSSKNSDISSLCRKVFQKLIVPFFIIGLIWCVFNMALWTKSGLFDVKLWSSYLLGTFISPGKSISWLHSACIYLWFLLALAEIKIIASLLNKIWHWIVTTIVCISIVFIIKKYNISLPFALDSAILALPFYGMGQYAKKYLLIESGLLWTTVCFLLCATATTLLFMINGRVDVNECMVGENIFLFYLCGMTGSLMVFYISKAVLSMKNIRVGKPITMLVSGAILIIGFSAYISSFIKSLLPLLVKNNIGGIFVGLLTLVVIYPLILMARRYFPAILGCRK